MADAPLDRMMFEESLQRACATARRAQRLAADAIASTGEAIADARAARQKAAAIRARVQARRSGEPGSGA